MLNRDLADEFRRSDVHKGPCPHYTEGQEFIVEQFGERPKDFPCDWAWNDIYKVVFTLMAGGNFRPWMESSNTFITCCTDGIKPVVFKVERIEG